MLSDKFNLNESTDGVSKNYLGALIATFKVKEKHFKSQKNFVLAAPTFTYFNVAGPKQTDSAKFPKRLLYQTSQKKKGNRQSQNVQ